MKIKGPSFKSYKRKKSKISYNSSVAKEECHLVTLSIIGLLCHELRWWQEDANGLVNTSKIMKDKSVELGE